jgi:hypothetical protein
MQAATERATPTPPPSKPLLDGYRARHDVPPEERFARTAVYSRTLYTMLLTQKVHLTPNTQQAEQDGFTRAKSDDDVPVNFS